jgi:hypothetical protein
LSVTVLAGHELVEIEDFVLRRKRKAVAPSPAAALPAQPSSSPAAAAIRQGLQLEANSPAAVRAEAAAEVQGGDDALMTDQAAQEEVATAAVEEEVPAAEAAAVAVAPAGNADEQQQQQPEQEQEHAQELDAAAAEEEAPLTAAEAAAEAPEAPAAPAQPAQFSVAPSELCDLVEWVFLNERKKLPGTTADAARAAAAQFRQAFSEQLQQHAASKAAGFEAGDAAEGQQGQGGAAAAAAAAAAPQLTVLPYLVEQQKAALQDKRAK